jgi:hypothetical protein
VTARRDGNRQSELRFMIDIDPWAHIDPSASAADRR